MNFFLFLTMFKKKRGKNTSKFVFPVVMLVVAILLVSILYVLVPPLFGKVTEGVNYPGPIAYYNFENRNALGDDIARTYDASCDPRIGRICPAYRTVNKNQGAADFSGRENRQLVLGTPISLPGEFTILFAVHQSEGGTIVWGSNGGIIIDSNTGRVQFSLLGSGFAASAPDPGGQWVHYALVRNNNGIVRFYKNGVQESGMYDVDGSLIIETLGFSSDQGNLQGFLDNLKIFDYALTEWQIRISGDLLAIENTASLCQDTIDNDNDEMVDCADENCQSLVVGSNGERCEFPEERSCQDGFDNNGDGRVDENCAILTEICADIIDNDEDGLIDEGCDGMPPTEVCDDERDNDGDGLVDEGCGVMTESTEICNDQMDNNDNNFIDENCPAQCTVNSLPSCSTEVQCTSTGGVWYVTDPGETEEPSLSICVECANNGDCAETETCRDYACISIVEVCADTIDNDGDGFVDEDCTTPVASEICGDNIDNDQDGMIDENCQITTSPEQGAPPPSGNTNAGTSSSGTRQTERTGRQACVSNWNCDIWTACNSTSQQSRTCADTNQCNLAQRMRQEVKACTFCTESWICQEWSSCQEGKQKRICVDEHACGSITQKPATEQECIAQLEIKELERSPPDLQKPFAVGKYISWSSGIAFFIAAITALILARKRKNKNNARNKGSRNK